MAFARFSVAAALALSGAGCVSDGGDDPDPSTVSQIESRIQGLETLRGRQLAENIEVLGVYLRPHSIPYILDAMEGSASPKVRAGCAQALGRSQDGRAVEPLAAAAVGDSNPGVRYTAAYNLCLFRDSRGLPVLFEALRSDDPINRKLAADGLSAVTGLDFGYDPSAPMEKRNEAVGRWEAWYRDLGPSGASMHLMPVRPPGKRSP